MRRRVRRRLWWYFYNSRRATWRGRLGPSRADRILGEVVVNFEGFLDGDGLAQLLTEAPSFLPDPSKSFAFHTRLPNSWLFIIFIIVSSRFGTNTLVDLLG